MNVLSAIDAIPVYVIVPVVLSLTWVAVWYVQTLVMVAAFDDNAEDIGIVWKILFAIPAITIAVMKDREPSRYDNDLKAYLTWGFRFVGLFWLSVIRLIVFAIGSVAYGIFALSRRFVNMKHDSLTSFMFGMVQMEAGFLDPNAVEAEKAELTNQLSVAQAQAFTNMTRAEELERELQIQQQIAHMARQNGWSQDDLWRWMQRSTGQVATQPTQVLPPTAQGYAFGNDNGWNAGSGELVDATVYSDIFDDNPELSDSEMTDLIAYMRQRGMEFNLNLNRDGNS